MNPIRTILHPTDFSESAEGAFSVATLLARQHGARIIVLHVCPPAAKGLSDEAGLWTRLGHYAAPGPETRVETRLVAGNPADEIARMAEEEGCDVVVMGTHGLTGVIKVQMGSVTEGVFGKVSRCPVVTVRIPSEVKPPAKPEKARFAAV
jgi:nucleotide-binding universal stress UspA family protein